VGTAHHLVVNAAGDAQVQMWNPDDGSIVRTFSGPGDYVYSVAASADGSRIADSVPFIRNAKSGEVLRKIEPPAHAAPRGQHRTASNRERSNHILP
jgi:hypothetical protein